MIIKCLSFYYNFDSQSLVHSVYTHTLCTSAQQELKMIMPKEQGRIYLLVGPRPNLLMGPMTHQLKTTIGQHLV